jgi:hypothetical protein
MSVTLDGYAAGPNQRLDKPFGDGAKRNGWWGDNPPYHASVYVLTHYAREPQAMQGGI